MPGKRQRTPQKRWKKAAPTNATPWQRAGSSFSESVQFPLVTGHVIALPSNALILQMYATNTFRIFDTDEIRIGGNVTGKSDDEQKGSRKSDADGNGRSHGFADDRALPRGRIKNSSEWHIPNFDARPKNLRPIHSLPRPREIGSARLRAFA